MDYLAQLKMRLLCIYGCKKPLPLSCHTTFCGGIKHEHTDLFAPCSSTNTQKGCMPIPEHFATLWKLISVCLWRDMRTPGILLQGISQAHIHAVWLQLQACIPQACRCTPQIRVRHAEALSCRTRFLNPRKQQGLTVQDNDHRFYLYLPIKQINHARTYLLRNKVYSL